MIASKYENTYVSVMQARKDSDIIDSVAKIIKAHNEPMTCEAIGCLFWGTEIYKKSRMSRTYSARLGQALSHLRKAGFIKSQEIQDGEVEIETCGYVPATPDEPEFIDAYDAKGRKFQVKNPDYVYGDWGCYTKKVPLMRKVWSWVEE